MHETAAETLPETSACAAFARALSEPLPGTAAVASSWLCLEQPGPWGSDALVQSHLDPALGEALAERSAGSGVRVQLIRRPGKHADTGERGALRGYLAHTHPERCWLRQWELTDPGDLLRLDFGRIAEGEHDGLGVPSDDPLLLVCTNGRRDLCCALHGRALIDEMAGRHDGSVWETTHTGGHRFAPAAVLLPSGYTYGQLTTSDADAALSAAVAGKLTTAQCRGRSTWSSRGQAAELAVREHLGEPSIDALRVEDESGDEVRVAHRNGGRWTVTVQEHRLAPPRPNSCGKEPARPSTFAATRIVTTPE